MEILYLLIALSVVLVIAVAGILLWAVRSGQYEDMEGPAWRLLADDDGIRQKPEDIDPDQVKPEPPGLTRIKPRPDSSH